MTNDDSAIGDALGITYPDGTQISSVIADILAPQNAYVENYNLQLEVLTPFGKLRLERNPFKVFRLELYLDRFDSIPSGSRIKLYYNDEYLAQSQEVNPAGREAW